MNGDIKCLIAKSSSMVREMAVTHYLNQGRKTPVFHFMSLYSDDEPYPLDELINVLEAQITTLDNEFKLTGRESFLLASAPLESKLKRLKKIKD